MQITNPAPILNSFEFCNNTWPKKVEAAPKIIKTIEKPIVKRMIGIKFIFFFLLTHLMKYQKYKRHNQVLMVIHMGIKNLSNPRLKQ